MAGDSKGSEILTLLDDLTSESVSEYVRDLYDRAYENRLDHVEIAVTVCEKALEKLDVSSQRHLPNLDILIYDKGRFHLLIASIYLDQERELDKAEVHYRASEAAFYTRQWNHLESLTYLGLAMTLQKMRRFEEAQEACVEALANINYESVPSNIDTTVLRQTIEKAKGEIENSFLYQEIDIVSDSSEHSEVWKIPILSDIAAGIGRSITAEYIQGSVEIAEREGKAADYFVVVVDGDSMADDNIMPGDKVLIRQQAEAENGDIVVLVIDTPEIEPLGVLKRYYLDERAGKAHWFLRSSNAAANNLVVIPPSTDVAEIRKIYDKELQAGTVKFYEQAELKIAGVCVEVVGKNLKDT